MLGELPVLPPASKPFSVELPQCRSSIPPPPPLYSLVHGGRAVDVIPPPAVVEERRAESGGQREVIPVPSPPAGQSPVGAVGPGPGGARVGPRGSDPREPSVPVSAVVDSLGLERQRWEGGRGGGEVCDGFEEVVTCSGKCLLCMEVHVKIDVFVKIDMKVECLANSDRVVMVQE